MRQPAVSRWVARPIGDRRLTPGTLTRSGDLRLPRPGRAPTLVRGFNLQTSWMRSLRRYRVSPRPPRSSDQVGPAQPRPCWPVRRGPAHRLRVRVSRVQAKPNWHQPLSGHIQMLSRRGHAKCSQLRVPVSDRSATLGRLQSSLSRQPAVHLSQPCVGIMNCLIEAPTTSHCNATPFFDDVSLFIYRTNGRIEIETRQITRLL